MVTMRRNNRSQYCIYLGRKRVGTIIPCEGPYTAGSLRWAYRPMGSKLTGESFANVQACFDSLRKDAS